MFAEAVATFTLVVVILGGLRYAAAAVPWLVGLTITAAYWFTSSTSFANPAVTLARGFTTTFAGIALGDVPGFILAQLIGAAIAVPVAMTLFPAPQRAAARRSAAHAVVGAFRGIGARGIEDRRAMRGRIEFATAAAPP